MAYICISQAGRPPAGPLTSSAVWGAAQHRAAPAQTHIQTHTQTQTQRDVALAQLFGMQNKHSCSRRRSAGSAASTLQTPAAHESRFSPKPTTSAQIRPGDTKNL